jgi:hypothetical protein
MGSRQTFYKIIKKEIPQTGQALRPLSVGHRGSPPQPPPHTGLHQHPSTTATRPSTPIHHRHQHHNHHISGCRVWGEGNPRGEDESRCPFIGSVVRHHYVSHPGGSSRPRREGARGYAWGSLWPPWSRRPPPWDLDQAAFLHAPDLPPSPLVGGKEEEAAWFAAASLRRRGGRGDCQISLLWCLLASRARSAAESMRRMGGRGVRRFLYAPPLHIASPLLPTAGFVGWGSWPTWGSGPRFFGPTADQTLQWACDGKTIF